MELNHLVIGHGDLGTHLQYQPDLLLDSPGKRLIECGSLSKHICALHTLPSLWLYFCFLFS